MACLQQNLPSSTSPLISCTCLPTAAKEPANAAFLKRPWQIKTNTRSAQGSSSIFNFPQLFMEEKDICCDVVVCWGIDPLRGYMADFDGCLTDPREMKEWHWHGGGGGVFGRKTFKYKFKCVKMKAWWLCTYPQMSPNENVNLHFTSGWRHVQACNEGGSHADKIPHIEHEP